MTLIDITTRYRNNRVDRKSYKRVKYGRTSNVTAILVTLKMSKKIISRKSM